MKEGSPRHIRFENEKKAPFRPAKGSWESVMVGLKDQYPENVFGAGEAEYWEPIEKQATMSLRSACFQYFLAGKGHLRLAEMVANKSQKTLSKDEREELVGKLAAFLYDNYPQSYKDRIKQ